MAFCVVAWYAWRHGTAICGANPPFNSAVSNNRTNTFITCNLGPGWPVTLNNMKNTKPPKTTINLRHCCNSTSKTKELTCGISGLPAFPVALASSNAAPPPSPNPSPKKPAALLPSLEKNCAIGGLVPCLPFDAVFLQKRKNLQSCWPHTIHVQKNNLRRGIAATLLMTLPPPTPRPLRKNPPAVSLALMTRPENFNGFGKVLSSFNAAYHQKKQSTCGIVGLWCHVKKRNWPAVLVVWLCVPAAWRCCLLQCCIP